MQFTSIILQLDGSWLFDWTPTSAAYYRLVLRGEQVGTVAAPPYTFMQPGFPSYPPPLELVEETALALSEQFPNELLIQWYSETCDYYTVSEIIGGNPVLLNSIVESGTEWIYSYTTSLLQDSSGHSYQVAAVGNGGQSSAPDTFAVNVVTPPSFIDGSRPVTYDKGTLSLVIS